MFNLLVTVLYPACTAGIGTVALKIQNFAKSVWIVTLICIHS